MSLSTTSPSSRSSITALAEVLGIYIAGQVLMIILIKLLGLDISNPLLSITNQTTPADLIPISLATAKILAVQYSGWFILILALTWWRKGFSPREYGLSLGQHSFFYLVTAGVVLFAFADLPVKGLELVNSYYSLGTQAEWREAIWQMNWRTPEFWLFMAVGSYGLIPIIEELFYRGYCQTRLEEGFGAPAAILMTACLFMLSHSQYYYFNLFNVSMLLFGILSAIAWGYIFYRTRSLVPVIVAHACINIPVAGIFIWVQIALMLLVCFLARQEIKHYLVEATQLLRSASPLLKIGLGVFATGGFVMGTVLLEDIFILLGLFFFVAAVGLIAWEKWQNRPKPLTQ